MPTTTSLLLFILGLCMILLFGSALGRAAPTVRFTDITTASGVRFQHQNSATKRKYLIETMTGGVAVFDYDNDGWLDLFFVNGARLKDPQPDFESPDKSAPEFWNRLYRNNHDGTFTDVTEKAGLQGLRYGMGIAVADYNNDGWQDLCVTNYGGALLYRNNGDGTFSDITSRAGLKTEGWTTGAGFTDFDNDGYLDLFICRYLQWNFQSGAVFCGEKRPGGQTYCHPDKFSPVTNYLFKNNGDGTFTDVSSSSGINKSPGKGLGVAFEDYDNDGWIDIYVANDSYAQSLFRNKGDGTFAEVGTMAGVSYTEDGKTFAGMGADFADVDGDNLPDIITTALPYEYYSFFHNNGNGTFSYLSLNSGLGEITRPFSGWGVRVFDYDNDGNKELFLANGHVMDNIELTQPHLSTRQRPLLLKYLFEKFTEIQGAGEIFQQKWSSRGAAFGDLDNDGDTDVVVSNCNGPAYVLRNDGGNKNHWLGVELRGTRANRDGIGSEISLVMKDGRVKSVRVSTAGSYLSGQDKRVLFGLGGASSIERVQVIWPGGARQEVVNPKVDQYLEIKQVVAKMSMP